MSNHSPTSASGWRAGFAVGAGLGLVMLTLLIASQHSVRREQLGITTSLNQFSRSIGGAIGVAILGAVLSAGLAQHSSNPNALVNAEARAQIPAAELALLRGALEGTLRNIFIVSASVVGLALLGALALPRGRMGEMHGEPGKRLVMAEMTTMDAEHEPEA